MPIINAGAGTLLGRSRNHAHPEAGNQGIEKGLQWQVRFERDRHFDRPWGLDGVDG